jgi:hypothetical protein
VKIRRQISDDRSRAEAYGSTRLARNRVGK